MENEMGENSNIVILGAKVISTCNNFISVNLTEPSLESKIGIAILDSMMTPYLY